MNLIWFRRDLRIEDNPALYNAAKNKEPVIAVYIETPVTWQTHNMGDVQKQWIYNNLHCLSKELEQIGIRLIYQSCDRFEGCPLLLLSLCESLSVNALYYNKEYEWDERCRDDSVQSLLSLKNIKSYAFDDQCLVPPDIIKNKQGSPYCVFTPFKKASYAYIKENQPSISTLPVPLKKSLLRTEIPENTLPNLKKPSINEINPGLKAAKKHLREFVIHRVVDYEKYRDFPNLNGTSMLSPYLALGIISVRQCLDILLADFNYNFDDILSNKGAEVWLSELIWRDFYRMICFNFPHVSRGIPFKKNTQKLKWDDNDYNFHAWANGQTGVPIVDSAMRQLNETGFMHNRLRMIVAMYLTKNLWQDWRKGEGYFASKLLDWDFCSNNGGWQWSASTGTDSVPYFRIFNPITQSQRFDPGGDFIRKYCPELRELDNKAIHDPFSQSKIVPAYPRQLVDLKISRQRAIYEFKNLG
ncbi:MAG: FAD-binding domain-containing protein [Legionellaceae bacterium]|nr:FAD-binding domain-containing protein [Legionellaceae bacterium]